jgi:hypothetical protein
MQQQIGFCSTADGARIAYATVGSGPPLLVAQAPSHLGLEWEEPRVRDFWETIGRHHLVIRYDKHGCGLSDRNRTTSTILGSNKQLVDVANFSSQLVRPERNQQGVADRTTLDITDHGSAAIGVFAQFCKRAPHLLRPYRGWTRIFGVQRHTHRDDGLVV